MHLLQSSGAWLERPKDATVIRLQEAPLRVLSVASTVRTQTVGTLLVCLLPRRRRRVPDPSVRG